MSTSVVTLWTILIGLSVISFLIVTQALFMSFGPVSTDGKNPDPKKTDPK